MRRKGYSLSLVILIIVIALIVGLVTYLTNFAPDNLKDEMNPSLSKEIKSPNSNNSPAKTDSNNTPKLIDLKVNSNNEITTATSHLCNFEFKYPEKAPNNELWQISDRKLSKSQFSRPFFEYTFTVFLPYADSPSFSAFCKENKQNLNIDQAFKEHRNNEKYDVAFNDEIVEEINTSFNGINVIRVTIENSAHVQTQEALDALPKFNTFYYFGIHENIIFLIFFGSPYPNDPFFKGFDDAIEKIVDSVVFL